MNLLLLLLGLATLVAGGELFIKGATRIAALFGLSPLVIGLTVVAFGTSAPELGVSLQASFNNLGSLAIGNVTGSNVFNVLGVLGLSALAAPLVIHSNLVKFDVPVMIFLSLLMGALAWDGGISRIDGVLLVLCAVAYTWLLFREAHREKKRNMEEGTHVVIEKDLKTYVLIIMLLSLGLLGLVLGARWTVEAAVEIAKHLQISERVIGVTIVAIGTSLPELATSVMAAARGQRDMAVGNVIGSNIMNIVLILGLTGAVSPATIPVEDGARLLDIPMAIFVAVLCFPFFRRSIMQRWVGALFLAIYVGYVFFLLR